MNSIMINNNIYINMQKRYLTTLHTLVEKSESFNFRPFKSAQAFKTARMKLNQNLMDQVTKRDENKSGMFILYARPYEEVPSPKGFPILGTLVQFMKASLTSNLHEYISKRHLNIGTIFREKLGPLQNLFLSDAEMFKEVFRQEGQCPMSFKSDAMKEYNKINNRSQGIFLMDGEEWLKYRKMLNNIMLKKSIAMVDVFFAYEQVISQYMLQWENICNVSNGVIPDLEAECYQWGFKGLASVLMGKSFQRQWHQLQGDTEECVQISKIISESLCKMQGFPANLSKEYQFPVWKDFSRAYKRSKEIGDSLIQNGIEDMHEGCTRQSPSPKEYGLMYKMMVKEQARDQEIVELFSDLLMSSIRPVGISLFWRIYSIAQHPDIQEKILQELNRVCGKNNPLEYKHLPQLSYLQLCIKESFRLYPTVPFIVKILQKESIIGGYRTPANTIVVLSLHSSQRNPSYFPDPERFWPERWSKSKSHYAVEADSSSGKNNSNVSERLIGVTNENAYLPFGMGARGCVGRTLGTSQLQLFIGRLIQTFRFECKPVNRVHKDIFVPGNNVQLKLTKRATIN